MVGRPSKPLVMLSVLGVVLVVGVVWAAVGGYFSKGGSGEAAAGDQSPFSVAALKKADPMENMKLMRSAELTDEQREELGRNLRQVWRERMEETMNEYFAAPEDQKVVILDRQIDEWMAMRKRMEEYREENPPTEEQEQRWRERMRSRMIPDYAERKERYESGESEDRARMMTYFMAARQRAQERGLDMGGPGWGRGPRGGGGNRSQEGNGNRPRRSGRDS